jgi:hypothetical protein
MNLYRIIFLYSDLITKEALILLHNDDRRFFEMEVAPNNRNALASLTEDLVLDILHHLPTRSLFSYKCVYRSWKRLIFDNRQVLPQTMVGFFYDSENDNQNFTSISGVCPLPSNSCPSTLII